jgi:uncharacterized membrane protein
MSGGPLPLPPAPILAEYEKAYPGLIAKFVEWTDSQRGHRQALENLRQERSERRMDRGQIIAGSVALWGLTVAAVVGIFGNPWVAGIIAIVAIGGPTAAVILARNTGPAKKPEPPKPQVPAPVSNPPSESVS